MACSIKNDERVLSENELATVVLNERSSSFFPQGTKFTFGESVKLVVKTTNAGRNYLKFADLLKALPNGEPKETTLSASLFLRCPFDKDDRKALEGRSTLQDEILKAVDSANPGKSLWDLFKGRTVIVKELVLAKDRPFGETSKVDMQYSIFDYA